MKLEIERKYKVHVAQLPLHYAQRSERLAQGYLSRQPTVRVRLAERPDGTLVGYLTIKGEGQLQRSEFEYEIPAADAQAMLNLCPHRLEKTRYFIQAGHHMWEVDRFAGRLEGLWLAEIELHNAAESFEVPSWLAEEVTFDGRYANSALAAAEKPPEQP